MASPINPEQMRLFDMPETPRHPGDMGFDEWRSQPDRVFHGTHVGPEYQPHRQMVTHWGTQQAAETVLGSDRRGEPGVIKMRGIQADSEDTEDPTIRVLPHEISPGVPAYGPGRVIAGRLTSTSEHRQVSDFVANEAHALYAWRRGSDEVPGSIADSLYTDMEHIWGSRPNFSRSRAAADLEAGRAVPYENVVEHKGSTSYVAPVGAVRTWEDDVLESDTGRVSPQFKDFIKSRVARGVEATVPLTDRKEVGVQHSLFGGSKPIYNDRQIPHYAPVSEERRRQHQEEMDNGW